MKLSPPASSSDLEAAREVARRLHQRRRSADRTDVEPGGAPVAPVQPVPRAPVAVETPPVQPVPRPPVAVETPPARPSAPPPARQEEPRSDSFDTALAFEILPTVPPSDPVPAGPPAADDGAAFALGAAIDFEPATAPEDQGPPSWDEVDAPAIPPAPENEPLEALATTVPDTDVSFDDVTGPLPVDAADAAPDEMVGTPVDVGVEDVPSPFDEAADADANDEELFDTTPPPSWDEVVDACLALAGARAAMIVDPAGQVFAARGSWPDPGPNAIASRLVSMMERTLRDAPTRSISAPLGGQHLTAWRVPLAEGLVTAAFIGDAPLRADVRPTIDAEIHRGPGA